jgi:hypothetical protein
MKVAIFAVQYKAKNFDNAYVSPVPREFQSKVRIQLFDELINHSRNNKIHLAILPGGFFRTNSPGGIANRLKHYPPKINVLVGWDNVAGDKREVWAIAKNGSITKRIPEAYEKNKSDKGKSKLINISDRSFQITNNMYSAYCCGDIIIDKRKFTYSKAAFVLAHFSAPGRSFTPAMRKLGIPTFLSHHVKKPSLKNNEYFAYNGGKLLKPIDEFKNTESQGLNWIARIYSV